MSKIVSVKYSRYCYGHISLSRLLKSSHPPYTYTVKRILSPTTSSVMKSNLKGVIMFTVITLLIATPVLVVLYMVGSKPTQARIEKIYDSSASKILDDLEARMKSE